MCCYFFFEWITIFSIVRFVIIVMQQDQIVSIHQNMQSMEHQIGGKVHHYQEEWNTMKLILQLTLDKWVFFIFNFIRCKNYLGPTTRKYLFQWNSLLQVKLYISYIEIRFITSLPEKQISFSYMYNRLLPQLKHEIYH